MEAENRNHAAQLKLDEKLERDGAQFEFFPLMRLLERLVSAGPRLGENGPYVEEAIRVRGNAELVFQSSEVTRVSTPRSAPQLDDQPAGGVYELTTAFLGLAGASSPLPTYLLEELVADNVEAEQRREFLDLFHHRIVSLFYRSIERFHYPAEYTSDAQDDWSRRLLALLGFSGHARRPRHLSYHQLLRLGPLFASMSRSAETLQLAIADVFDTALAGATVDIETLTGGWARLGEPQQARLGAVNHVLGEDLVLGDRCFDRASRAKITLNGLGEHSFRRFMRDGDLFPALLEVLDLFTRDPVRFDLELVLDNATRPGMRLGVAEASTLGTDSWLAGQDHDETRVRIELPTTRAA